MYQSEQALHLAARVIEHAREGVMITDADVHLLDVNPMFAEITGYHHDEVLGRNPSILASGRHGNAFYREMRRSLGDTGNWEGETWNRRKDGEFYPERISISVVKDPNTGDVLNYVGLFADATESRQQQEQLKYLAHHDVLTDLPNRFLLMDRLKVAIARSLRHQHRLALVFTDLDGFKPVNDRYGHAVGDLVLVEVARRLRHNLREEDTVARPGGDEFALLYTDLSDEKEVRQFVQRLLGELSLPYRLDGHRVSISACAGVATCPGDATEPGCLLQLADNAMYEAKRAGRGEIEFVSRIAGEPD